jgi:hypothetical protein
VQTAWRRLVLPLFLIQKPTFQQPETGLSTRLIRQSLRTASICPKDDKVPR